jgi:hypothetical protein
MINFPANDPPAEAYPNQFTSPPGHIVLRWWVPGYPLLVGGNLQSVEDWNHLRDDFGITHVLDVEAGRPPVVVLPDGHYKKIEMVDNGMPMAAELIREAVTFARDALKEPGAKLYTHCHMGASRSPAYTYAILRCVFGLSHDDGLVAINRGFPHGEGWEWSYHQAQQAYVGAIDAFCDRGGIG